MKPEELVDLKSIDYIQQHSGIVSVNKLLERPLEEEHIEEWTQLLAQPVEGPKETHEMVVVIFRLGSELLALSTNVFVEVAENRKIHRIPHRTNSILLGMVNIKGQLQLCAALHELLQIKINAESEPTITHRMLFIQKNGENWIFPVNEVFGIHYCDSINLTNVPVTISKSSTNFLKGVINWNGKTVGYLDEDLIFNRLNAELGFQNRQ